MLEDACLLSDASVLASLFDNDAVLLSGATSGVPRALRHRRGDHRPPSAWAGGYVAAPQLVMQSGRLALIISGTATSVARRGHRDGWHSVISRLDL